MYEDLKKDVANGLTFEQLIFGFAPALCGKLNRKQKLVAKAELRNKLNDMRRELKRIQSLTEMEAELEHKAEYDKDIIAHEELVSRNTEQRKKYMELIEKTRNWDVTPYHDTMGQLQSAIIRDLTYFMEQDCYIPKASPTRYTGVDWKNAKIQAFEIMIADYEEAWKNEQVLIGQIYELLSREKYLQPVKNT